MRADGEFKIRNNAGRELILQKIVAGDSYLDQGMTHLPRDFQGYRVKFTDKTAELKRDGSFKVSHGEGVFKRVD